MAPAGRFITLEGGEGAGKTTVLESMVEWARQRGYSVVETREPGGTAVGEQIRGILLDPEFSEMTPTTELLLMFAARAQHVAQVIRPALEAGHWVISDRFTDASMAYQGYGRGLGRQAVEALAGLVHPGLAPDLTILLDLPVDRGLARIRQRGEPDRFEADRTRFLERVRQGYRAMAAADPARLVLVDADRPAERVRSEVLALLGERLA